MKKGDYVRSSWGTFNRIKEYKSYGNKTDFSILLEGEYYSIHYKNKIQFNNDFRSSENVVDLLKKRDLVVGYDDNIYQVQKVYMGYVFTDKKNKYGQIITLVDYQIKSIITKEELERIKYELD